MDARAALTQALACHKAGDLAQAESLYAQLLAARPDHPQVTYLMGALRGQQGRHDEALELLQAAQGALPGDPAILLHMGIALQGLERFDDALARYDQALAINPRLDDALNNRANALRALGRFDEALAGFDAALALRPDNAEFWFNRGAALLEMKRPAEAVADFDRARALRPNFTRALYFTGRALLALKIPDPALACFEGALEAEPGNIEFQMYRAIALYELKRLAEALETFDRLRMLKPPPRDALGYAAQSAVELCEWPRMEAMRPCVLEQVRTGTPEIHPLLLMSYCDDPGLQRRAAENTVKAMFPETPAPFPPAASRKPGRIRIVYVSSDFQVHPVGLQMVQILEQHDRERFEVIAVSTGKDEGSEIRARIMRACDRFHDAQGRTGREIAELLRGLEPDIAVDMTGHTFGNSLFAFARRPSPIQVAWLGYPGTTGAPFIDYILADPVVLPHEQQPFYSETILHLPDSFFPMDTARPVGTAPGRARAGLPENAFVFCCFNQSWKITQATFDIWMRLLKAVPDSVLWLKEGRNECLRHEAAARGVAPERLVFAQQAPQETHLARHGLADLFLDTLPYNAHATAADALLAGLPVLTQLGRAFPGRVAASLVRAAGLPELVARDAQEYEALALELARDPSRLAVLREKLSANRATAPLFDSGRFARNLEAAYEAMLAMKR